MANVNDNDDPVSRQPGIKTSYHKAIFAVSKRAINRRIIVVRMGQSAIMGSVVFGAIGLFVGWHACKAWLAHADIGGTVRKISGLKRARSNNGQIAIVIFSLALIALYGLIRH
jgi:hypothetical protein